MGERVGDVVLEEDGPVLRATLDRPAARNAINVGLLEGLEAAVERAIAGHARVLVVRGAGGTFCAGADLGLVLSTVDDRDALAGFVTRLAATFDAIEAAPFASLAIVEGYALAGGCELLMACDVIVADEAARIGDRHLELALLPGGGGSVRLHQALSPARSRWLLLSGQMITGREAAEWGLVTRAVPRAELDATAEDMVARLASRSPAALAGAKEMAMTVRDLPVAAGIEAERRVFLRHLAGSGDARAALHAFLRPEEDGTAGTSGEESALRGTGERIVLPGAWHLEYAHSAGRAASRFLVALRDRQRLLGSPCPGCARVLVPPRSFCEDCFVATSDDWVEVGPEGVVEAFTFTYAAFAGYAEPPYGVAYVRPDGASTALGNLVGGIDLSEAAAAARDLAIGTRMRAVFRPDRQARITDFRWEPAG